MKLGPGKMTDWREIVSIIQDFAASHRERLKPLPDKTRIPKPWLTPSPLVNPQIPESWIKASATLNQRPIDPLVMKYGYGVQHGI